MYSELIKKLKSINDNYIYVNINKWTLDNSENILKLAKDRMIRGEGVFGGNIGLYSWASYEYFKFTEINPLAGGKVDLFLTGALYNGMRIIPIKQGEYKIISTDDKYEMLADKYGSEQFGLTEEQKEQVINEGMNYLINEIYKNYG